jgi:MOSC domain-containing protein YiiM
MLWRVEHLDLSALESGLDEIRLSPKAKGRLELIVRRPEIGQREVLTEASLDTAVGLDGDNWGTRSVEPQPKAQITLTNARAIALVARKPERWSLAGDQLYVDFDLGGENAPPGTRLAIGSAVVEITELPHRGCRKYLDRFGADALKFVNSEAGLELNLRGVNARVVVAGTVRTGDAVEKIEP